MKAGFPRLQTALILAGLCLTGSAVAMGKKPLPPEPLPRSSCANFDETAPVGTMCVTPKKFWFERVKGGWRDITSGRTWFDLDGDLWPGYMQHIALDGCHRIGQILPSKEEFELAESHGFRDAVKVSAAELWTRTRQADADHAETFAYVFKATGPSLEAPGGKTSTFLNLLAVQHARLCISTLTVNPWCVSGNNAPVKAGPLPACGATPQASPAGTQCVTSKGFVFQRTESGWKDSETGRIWFDARYVNNQEGWLDFRSQCPGRDQVLPEVHDFEVAEEHGFREALKDMLPPSDPDAIALRYWTSTSNCGVGICAPPRTFVFDTREGSAFASPWSDLNIKGENDDVVTRCISVPCLFSGTLQ